MDDPLIDRIEHMDLDRTTPMDALIELKDLQEEVKRRRKYLHDFQRDDAGLSRKL